jgi:RNA polymerase sigma-70 factor (ECF subfamily)
MSQSQCCGLAGGEECRCHTHPHELAAAVRGFVGNRVRDRDDVDDIAQETLLRLYRSVDTLRDARALEAWAFRIARNAIADHYRRPGGRATPVEPRQVAELLPLVDDHAVGDPTEELGACVIGLLDQVPPPYRRALELTDVQGMTQSRAAAELGLSTSGMKSRVQRGRRMLREQVASCCRIALDSQGGLADLTPHERDHASTRE